MDFKEGLEPVSPTGQYFTSSVLSISIIVVFEFEVPIKLMPIMTWLHDAFLVDPRLSSVMVLISLSLSLSLLIYIYIYIYFFFSVLLYIFQNRKQYAHLQIGIVVKCLTS